MVAVNGGGLPPGLLFALALAALIGAICLLGVLATAWIVL
ncbi:hypothetical protein GCM10017774_77970 [Lentzea cavernae]|uniref:Uncharacterized protein n=1 Tax=Lentzea cavernae TaxID=2020703 RepID=A0ABQ3MRQ9_9PSEU|nr:hypothetical protein GCM10017774_77970 [Lentzea cavernae]